MVHVPEQFHKYRGREFEADMLGEIDIFDPKFQRALKEIVERVGKRYVPYKDALDLARQFQSGDPKNPKKDFLRELRLAVAKRLGYETDEQLDRIGAYTALKSPLDVFHGVDGFIEVKEPNRPAEVVTLDLSLNPDKIAKGAKADIVVGDLPDADEDEAAYLKELASLAEVIVAKIRGQKAKA